MHRSAVTIGEIVVHHDLMTMLAEVTNAMAADIASTAGDKNTHGMRLPVSGVHQPLHHTRQWRAELPATTADRDAGRYTIPQ
ncbi:MAG: hypothetical protein AMXMBFR13_45620 [Phycisphaerae bacterium]